MNITDIFRLPRGRAARAAQQPALPWQTLRWQAGAVVTVLVFLTVRLISGQWQVALLAGWDAGLLTYLLLTSVMLAPASAEPAATVTANGVVGVTAVALLGFGLALLLAGQVGQPHSTLQAALVALAVGAVVASWLLGRGECRLHLARLRDEQSRASRAGSPRTGGQPAPESPFKEDLGFWEFAYYAAPILPYGGRADPAPVTPAGAKASVLYSIVAYTAIAILLSFGLSLLGPALNSVRLILGA